MGFSLESSLFKQGHTPLVEWWYNQSSLLSSLAYNSSTLISKKLDQQWSASEYTCGFEFHHYDLDRNPDFLVFGETNHLNNCPDLDLPLWWSNYEQSISDLQKKRTSNEVNYSILSENWLEFDMINSDLTLVGIWQAIHNHSFCNMQDWIQLSEALSYTFLSQESLTKSKQIIDFIRHFSIPSQIGLMYKRTSNVKLMAQLTTQEQLDKLISYFNTFEADESSELCHIFSSLVKIGPILRPAISIDINTEDSHKDPIVSIEIHQKKQIGRKLLPETKFFIEDICKIDHNQIISLEKTLNCLPSSSKATITDLNGQLKTQIRIARLNHLKISFTNKNKKLKSYIRLVEQNI